MHEFDGKTALVTGASSGLGADFARQLAATGCHLVLVARRLDRLKALKKEIQDRHEVAIEVIDCDLAAAGAVADLHGGLAKAHDISILINNAGFGIAGPFLETGWDRQKAMMDLNLTALTELCWLFGRDMTKRGRGHILLLGSIAGFQPMPLFAGYAAGKSYVRLFGEALNVELKAQGVSVTVLSPGMTQTEFHQVAGLANTRRQRAVMMDSAAVARIGLAAMVARKPAVVAGLANKLAAFSTRLAPSRLTAAVSHALMKNR